jgi:hypothetical protein
LGGKKQRKKNRLVKKKRTIDTMPLKSYYLSLIFILALYLNSQEGTPCEDHNQVNTMTFLEFSANKLSNCQVVNFYSNIQVDFPIKESSYNLITII